MCTTETKDLVTNEIKAIEDIILFKFSAKVRVQYRPPFPFMKVVEDTVEIELPYSYGIGYTNLEAFTNFLRDITSYYNGLASDSQGDTPTGEAVAIMKDEIRSSIRTQFLKFQRNRYMKYTVISALTGCTSIDDIIGCEAVEWEQEPISWNDITMLDWDLDMGPDTQKMLQGISGFVIGKIGLYTRVFPIDMFKEIIDLTKRRDNNKD